MLIDALAPALRVLEVIRELGCFITDQQGGDYCLMGAVLVAGLGGFPYKPAFGLRFDSEILEDLIELSLALWVA